MNLVRPNTDDFSVFVGDLAPDVTEYVLQETFRQFYPSVRSAKVIVDPATGRSKGYGFVRFANESERDRSLEMQGFQLSNRPVRVSLATARRSPSAGMPGIHPAELDPTNTTLFIGGLSAGVTEEQLRAIFARYGDVVYTKIPQGKGCGFVQFVNRPDAELAMAEMNGQVVGSSAIRISWGRSTSRAAALQSHQQQRPLLAAMGTTVYAVGGAYSSLDAYSSPVTLAAPPSAGVYTVGTTIAPAALNSSIVYGNTYGGDVAVDNSFALRAQSYTNNLAGIPMQSALSSAMASSPLLVAGALATDPLTTDVGKLNVMLMQRQQPSLTGTFMRPL